MKVREECSKCGAKSYSTTLCLFGGLGKKSFEDEQKVKGYLICVNCMKEPENLEGLECMEFGLKPKSRKTLVGDEKNAPSLWWLALRTIALGVLNRAPCFSVQILGEKLDHRSKQLVLDLVLEYGHIESDQFKNFIKRFGWQSGEQRMKKLELVNMNLKRDELSFLEYFCQTGSIDMLNVSWNRFGVSGVREVASILQYDTCRKVDVSWNKIGPEGAIALALKLPNCCKLVHLNLSSNSIGPMGAVQIAQSLSRNKSLEVLNLSFNGILAQGAIALSRALTRNRTLKELNVRSNRIGPAGAVGLAQALRVNFHIEKVIVADNNIGQEGAEEIAKFFQGPMSDLIECIGGNVVANKK